MNKKFLSRILLILLSAILIFSCVPSFAITSNALGAEAISENNSIKQYVFDKFDSFETTINITSFKIPADEYQIFFDIIKEYNSNPENFHCPDATVYMTNVYCVKIEVTYSCTKKEYNERLKKFTAVTSNLLEGIENNTSLTDIEKALLLHDRLALWNSYDYENFNKNYIPMDSYTAYGAFVNRTSVCEGYTAAYSYLLSKVGIKSERCTSEQLYHAWNIVYINEKPYHVDVTWDDGMVEGEVHHNNFLLSSKAFFESGHNATDYDTSPKDTTYDSYFWQDSDTAFQLIDNKLYYVAFSTPYIKSYKDGIISNVLNIRNEHFSYVFYNYNRLSTDGENLIYSGAKSIYSYNLKTQVKKVIFTPQLKTNEKIFGFTLKDNELICCIAASPNDYSSEKTYDNYRIIKETYVPPVIIPTVTTSSIYKVSGGKISKITAGTTVEAMLANITAGAYCKVFKGDIEIPATSKIGTGMTVSIMDGNSVITSYTAFVTGDSNGDGNSNICDLLRAKKCLAGVLNDKTEQSYCDMNEDGVIDENDITFETRLILNDY